MSALRTAQQVADEFGCSAWTVMELARKGKIPCVRISTTEGGSGLVRFTDEQVAQIIASLTVEVPEPTATHRRKRRAS